MSYFFKYFLAFSLALSAVPSFAQTLFMPEQLHKAAPKVPSYIVFAGDTIRFNRSELIERMDRELISFTYMHSTSLLLLKRAPRFFQQVEPVLKSMGVPDDFKYLMAIESTLDPTSLSSANAAGLWQFVKTTAQSYGLEVGSEVDERYNTRKATEAACKYIKEAYEKYGDWLTVAASYNAGQNGISNRIEKQRQKSALDLWMLEETSRYIFRILSAKMLFQRPEAFGFHVDDADRYPYIPPVQVVTVTGSIPSLVDFAEKYGVTYAQLKRENLWLRSDKLTNQAHKTYLIAIPSGR